MSGNVRGKVECFIGTGITNSINPSYINQMAQEAFKNLYDFFSTHPNYTIVSLQYGATTPLVSGAPTGGSGTGVGYFDSVNSFGYNAFFVARANATTTRPYDVYHLFQWTGSSNQSAPILGTTPGNPAIANGVLASAGLGGNNTFICHACAIGVGGSGGSVLSPNNGNPWKGTTNANGADTKGSIVWGAPTGGTGVIIFPRSNSGVGAFRQLTQNLSIIITFNTVNNTNAPSRMNIVADDDSFCIMCDLLDTGAYSMSFSGIYVPRLNLTNSYPYCCISTYTALPWGVTAGGTYGDVAGTSAAQGGIVSPVSASVFGLQLDHYSAFATTMDFWPNHAFATTTYDELNIPVGIYETVPAQISGLLGQIDFVREMFNIPTNYVKADFSYAVIGSATINDRKYFVPWDSQYKTVPRSGVTRSGISFVQSS